MTFDASLNTTYGEALAQMRDKITGLTNWSLNDESSAGTVSFGPDDWFVATTPEGSDIRITVDGTRQEMELEHGPDWDSANGVWNDQYSKTYEAYPIDGDNYNSMSMDDQVRWWIEYVNSKGFAVAMTREEGDGDDEGMMIGVAELTRLWDYTTAQVRESKYTALMVGHQSSDYGDEIEKVSATFEGGETDDTYDGKGEVNADGNNDNYPMVETTLQASFKYEDALIGEHDLWILDQSGDRSAHLDTITQGGVDTFTIFKDGMPENVALRMD